MTDKKLNRNNPTDALDYLEATEFDYAQAKSKYHYLQLESKISELVLSESIDNVSFVENQLGHCFSRAKIIEEAEYNYTLLSERRKRANLIISMNITTWNATSKNPDHHI